MFYYSYLILNTDVLNIVYEKMKYVCIFPSELDYGMTRVVEINPRGTKEADYLTLPIPSLAARFMGPTWGPSGPTGPRWAPCLPHRLCYLGWSLGPSVVIVLIYVSWNIPASSVDLLNLRAIRDIIWGDFYNMTTSLQRIKTLRGTV